ncbi:MAG TPA: hypothetical protein VIG33_00365 [Pseudobdellovibrionaceae bacterium]|jgi:hypothetical protein
MKFLTLIKEKIMEKVDKKHVKKLKPKTTQTANFGHGNGSNPCPPVGGDLITEN